MLSYVLPVANKSRNCVDIYLTQHLPHWWSPFPRLLVVSLLL